MKLVAFRDRREAGLTLATKLLKYAGKPGVLVLALPRGGVPVGFEVARALRAPLDIFVVRKIGVPNHDELALGATASGNVRVINREIVESFGINAEVVENAAAREEREVEERERHYRDAREPAAVKGKILILVDDGLATGSTMRAAVTALKQRGPARLIVAVPVAARETCAEFADEVDETVCAETPEPFYAVGEWYEDFSQTSEAEVCALLRRAAASRAS